jgi:serine protease
MALALAGAAGARAADYVPGEVVVGYSAVPTAQMTRAINARVGARSLPVAPAPGEHVLKLPPGMGVARAIARLRSQPGVTYAVPDFIAHADGIYVPDDRGTSHVRGGWESLQWNFLPGAGVDAPLAWANLIADRRPGGRGVTVAVLDTGVAYRNWRQYRESPDFNGTRFVAPYDFVSHNAFPLDREGHGTFVAGTIAETTNNGFAVTGLAYGASIMPVRVLDADGTGDATTIARGIRYAADHGAQVINLSLEFSLDVSPADIPDIISAIRYAHQHGVVVVAASGNEGVEQLAYPARAPLVISVGATTRDRCLADYSNGGPGLDLVAPGGGDDTSLLQDPNCHPDRELPTIYQMTLTNPSNPNRFGLPDGIYGTSMSAPHVAATVALVIASRVLGPHPTPSRLLTRLETTAQHLGGRWPNQDYGYGLIDAGAATAPIAGLARAR